MVADGAMEEEGVGSASITPKATRKMPKQKRKLGRYAARGKKHKKHRPLDSHPNPHNPPSHRSATLPRTVRPNPSLRISKAEFATELKSTRIKVRLTKNKLEKQKSENASISRVKDRQAGLRRKDRQNKLTIGSLLTDIRKFGKKTSSALNKSKMKVSELESSLISKKAEYTLNSQRIVASKDEEREVSSIFVPFVLIFVI